MLELAKLPPRQAGSFPPHVVADARERGSLLSVWLNLSNVCNLRCQYCFNSAGRKLCGEMELPMLLSAVRQLKALGGRTVTIPGLGEPLLDPNFLPLLAEVHGLGMATVLFTNGILVDEACAKHLYESGGTVVLKWNSFDDAVHDALVGRKGHAIQVRRAMDILLAQGFADSTPSRLSIANSIFVPNADEIPDMYRWAREHNVIPRISTLLEKGSGRHCAHLNPPRRKREAVYRELLRIDREEFGYDWIPNPTYAGDKCEMLFYNLFIDGLGNIQPCIGITHSLGNLRTHSLAEIWDCPLIQRTRRIDELLQGKCAECRYCRELGCYGCAGRRFIASGGDVEAVFGTNGCDGFKQAEGRMSIC